MKTLEQMGETEPEKKEGIKTIRVDYDPEGIEYIKSFEEKTLNTYRNNKRFKKIIEELEKIAKDQDFKGLTISDKDISVGGHGVYDFEGKDEKNVKKFGIFKNDESVVRFGENTMENVRELFEVDLKFAREGMADVMKHERQHLLGSAAKFTEREYEEFKNTIDQETTDKQIIISKGEKIHDKYYPFAEKQAELQRLNAYYDNLDDFIETEARKIVTLMVAYNGFSYLQKNIFDPSIAILGSVFDRIKKKMKVEISENNIKEIELHKKIIERMEEMRKDLVKKYEEHKHKGEF